MLRYADAIVKRGVDKLIDAIAYSAENISYKSIHKIHKRPLRGWPRTNVRVVQETQGLTP